MILNIKSYLLKIDIYSILVLLIFLAAPLRFYVSTSIILEIVTFGLVVWGFAKHKFTKKIWSPTASKFVVYFFIYFIISSFISYNGFDEAGFANENYRFFLFLIMLAVMASLPLDFDKLSKLCLWCCKMHILFTLYEFTYINLLALGDYDGIFLVGKAMASYDVDSQYLRESDNLGLMAIRPFGLMLQPQKSGFVFCVGIILQYIRNRLSHSHFTNLWYILFVVAIFLTGAKTALLCALVLLIAIKLNIYLGQKMTRKRLGIYHVIIFVLIVYSLFIGIDIQNIALISSNSARNDVLNDNLCFLNYDIPNILLGIGIPYQKSLLIHGYICECFEVRLLAQVGIVNFILLLWFLKSFYKTYDKRLNFMLLITLFFMCLHYCVINAYFISFCMIVIYCYAKQYKIYTM